MCSPLKEERGGQCRYEKRARQGEEGWWAWRPEVVDYPWFLP